MQTAGTIYGEVLRELKKAGIRLDDAELAANIADRVLRKRRDTILMAGRNAGIPVRKLGEICGLSHVQVLRITSNKTDGTYEECKRTNTLGNTGIVKN